MNITPSQDKSKSPLDRKRLHLETFIIEDESLEQLYLENVVIDILRLCEKQTLRKLHIRAGPKINFSKYSPTLAYFFDELAKFTKLESLQIKEFDLEEDNLMDFIDNIKLEELFRNLRHLDLSDNSINDV